MSRDSDKYRDPDVETTRADATGSGTGYRNPKVTTAEDTGGGSGGMMKWIIIGVVALIALLVILFLVGIL